MKKLLSLILLFCFQNLHAQDFSYAQEPLFSLSVMDSTNIEIEVIVKNKMQKQNMQDSVLFLTKRGWPEDKAYDNISKGIRNKILEKEFPFVFRMTCRKIFKNSVVVTDQIVKEAKANNERPDFSDYFIPLEIRKTWMAYSKTIYWDYQKDIQSQFSKRLWIDYSKACINHLQIYYKNSQYLKHYYPNFEQLSNRIQGNY